MTEALAEVIRVDGRGCAARATRERHKDNDNAKLSERKLAPGEVLLCGLADGGRQEVCKSLRKLE